MLVFVGYDAREHDAYKVCEHSLKPAKVFPLKHKELRHIGLFDRPWRIGETGQYVDERDGKPFSTEFSHSRFLVPHYVKKLKLSVPWALFCDCDFLFRGHIGDLFDLADDRYAVMCVQHKHTPPLGLKMDGVAQTQYFRKNWSSLILWNLNHPANERLTVDDVNHKPGSWLHAFKWLEDDLIGSLPGEWNYLVGTSPPDVIPRGIHYTEGGPWFPQYRNVPFAQEWRDARFKMMAEELRGL